MRFARALLVVAALLFSQHAAVLHDLAHAKHDLAAATKPGKAPALGHGADVCAAFGALAHAIGDLPAPFAVESAAVAALAPTLGSRPASSRPAFLSRAPPSLT